MEVAASPGGTPDYTPRDEAQPHLDVLRTTTSIEEFDKAMEGLVECRGDKDKLEPMDLTLAVEGLLRVIKHTSDWGAMACFVARHEELEDHIPEDDVEAFEAAMQAVRDIPGLIAIGTEDYAYGARVTQVTDLIASRLEPLLARVEHPEKCRIPTNLVDAVKAFADPEEILPDRLESHVWKSLEPGQCALFYMGACTKTGVGHTIMGMLVREKDKTLTLWVGNTGNGILFHPARQMPRPQKISLKEDYRESKEVYYQAYQIKNVNEGALDDFLAKMGQVVPTIDQYVDDLYRQWLPTLGSREPLQEDTVMDYRAQVAGSCTRAMIPLLRAMKISRPLIRDLVASVQQAQIDSAFARRREGIAHFKADHAALVAARRLFNRDVKRSSDLPKELLDCAAIITSLWNALPRRPPHSVRGFTKLIMDMLMAEPGKARKLLGQMSHEVLHTLRLFLPYLTEVQRDFLSDVLSQPAKGELARLAEALIAVKGRPAPPASYEALMQLSDKIVERATHATTAEDREALIQQLKAWPLPPQNDSANAVLFALFDDTVGQVREVLQRTLEGRNFVSKSSILNYRS